jgi:hypothetical protein
VSLSGLAFVASQEVSRKRLADLVLIPFFDTCLADARVKEVADGSWLMLKQSWSIDPCNVAANRLTCVILLSLAFIMVIQLRFKLPIGFRCVFAVLIY